MGNASDGRHAAGWPVVDIGSGGGRLAIAVAGGEGQRTGYFRPILLCQSGLAGFAAAFSSQQASGIINAQMFHGYGTGYLAQVGDDIVDAEHAVRSEEHTSELQSRP